MHDWIDLALGIVVSAGGWLSNRLMRHIDVLEKGQRDLIETQHKYGREIRDTRQAVSRIEGKLDMEPFPYTSE